MSAGNDIAQLKYEILKELEKLIQLADKMIALAEEIKEVRRNLKRLAELASKMED